MPKLGPWFGYSPAVFSMRRKKSIEGNLPQSDDHTEAFKQFEFFYEVRPAALKFNPARFILRRRAPDRRGNITISQLQAVVPMNRLRLICESRSVERSVEPVAAAIPGKHSAGSIAAMGRRSKADNQETRLGIAKTRQGFRPVTFAVVASRRCLGDRFAPAHQPRAFVASSNRLLEPSKTAHGSDC